MSLTLKKKQRKPKKIELRKAVMKALVESPEMKKIADAIRRDIFLWATKP